MRIERLQIQGFRSLRDVVWEPGNLNVIIGPNGSGKSNLLRAMEALRASAAGNFNDEIIRSGGTKAVAWDGQARNIKWDIVVDCRGDFPNRALEALRYQLSLDTSATEGRVLIETESLTPIDKEHTTLLGGTPDLIHRRYEKVTITDSRSNRLSLQSREIKANETVLSSTNSTFSYDITARFQRWVWMWNIHYDIDVSVNSNIRRSSVVQKTLRLESDAQNLVAYLHTLYSDDRDFKNVVDDALRAAFGLEYVEMVFPPGDDQRIQLGIRWRSLQRRRTATDLSDGILRFLVLVAILANPTQDSVIAFDEPEAGLHPCMLPIIAELAVSASENAQIIFTTHSPEFLEAFSETMPTTTIAESEEGKTKLSVIDGEALKKWLDDYSLGAAFLSGELETLL